jgi:hypothetical protein
VTEHTHDEVEPEAEQAEQEAPQAEPNMEEAPIYVYAIAMMGDGEVKLITQLPFLAHRQALMSDVVMTSTYIASAIKDGKL